MLFLVLLLIKLTVFPYSVERFIYFKLNLNDAE